MADETGIESLAQASYGNDGGDVPDLPTTLDQKSARKLLEAHGWTRTKGGKHVIKMEKQGKRPITLPKHGGQ